MCGKNKGLSSRPKFGVGSPPRVREKLISCNVVFTNRRITPACAGKTIDLFAGIGGFRDHPRVCGKNFKVMFSSLVSPGSPPRVREKLIWYGVAFLYFRITPACAGKTPCSAQLEMNSWDHPRVCGKNVVIMEKLKKSLGSPPRVREKH